MFRTYNNGPLWQIWASSVSKFTVDELKKKQKWDLKVLGLEKWVVLAAEKNHNCKKCFMFQVYRNGTKNTTLTTMDQSSKLGPLAFANLL